MKKLPYLLFFAVQALSFALQAQNALTFNFEDNAIPAGWTNDGTYPWVVTATSHTDAGGHTHRGTYCIKSSNSGVGNSESSISATFDFAVGGSVSFYGGCWGEGSSMVWDRCVFMIDGEEQFVHGALAAWSTYSFQVSAGTHTFTWSYSKDVGVNPPGDAFFVDDIVVVGGQVPTCFNVQNLTVSAVTSNSVTLSWVDTINTGATYSVYDMSDTMVINAAIGGNTATVGGLNGNTEYVFGVKTECDGDDESVEYATVTVRTACAVIDELPVTWGFEPDELPTGNYVLPYCWSRYNSVAASFAYYPYVFHSSAHSGSCALEILCNPLYTIFPDTITAFMPAIDVNVYPMNGNRVVFWAKVLGNDSQTFYFGTMSDLGDASSFVMVDSVVLSGSTYRKYAVPLTASPAFNAYVVFTTYKGNATIYIDDVTIEEIPDCYEVSDLTVVDSLSTTNSLTIAWADDENDSATYVVYDMADMSVLMAGVTDTFVTVTNLLPGTQYTLGVQANCANGPAACVTVSGYTRCAAFPLPFTETFDNTYSCWVGGEQLAANVFAGQELILTTPKWTYDSSYNSGLLGGHFYTNIRGNNCKAWIISPEIDLVNAASALLSFDAVFTQGNNIAPANGVIDDDFFLVIISTDNGRTWDSANAIPVNLASLAGTEYVTRYINLSQYVGEVVRIAFYAESTVAGGENNLHIDNISVVEPAGSFCYPPTDLSVDDITSSGATLTWNGCARSYTLYAMTDADTVSYGYTDTVAHLFYLQPNTQYTYGVAANCIDGNESPMTVISFRTDCGIESLPFTEDFYAPLDYNSCWTGVQWTYSSNGCDGLPGGHYFKQVGGRNLSSWMFTPLIDLSDATTAQLTFDAVLTARDAAAEPPTPGYDTNTRQAFIVYISTDGGNNWPEENAIRWQAQGGQYYLDDIAGTNYFPQIVNLDNYVGDTIKIAFYCQSHWSGGETDLHIDNIFVGERSGIPVDPSDSVTIMAKTAVPAHGTVTPQGLTQYALGDTATYTAVPDNGYSFACWIVSHVNPPMSTERDTVYSATYSFVADANMLGGFVSLKAVFMQDSMTIVIATADAAIGTTDPAPGTYRFAFDDNVLIHPVPNRGNQFLYWETELVDGSNSTTDTVYSEELQLWSICDFSPSSVFTVMAFFNLGYSVTVNYDATMGTVSGIPTTTVEPGTSVTLTAIPNDGYDFLSWESGGVATSGDNPYTFTVDEDIVLTAVFERINDINDVASADIKVFTQADRVVVSGAEGLQMMLYDIMGRKLVACQIPNNVFYIPHIPSGVYMVKVGAFPVKKVVVVR